MHQGNVFKLKKDKVDTWKDWSAFLNNHKEEALTTLREENILYEGSLLFQMQNDWYVCLFAYTENGLIKSANLDTELNVTHKEKMRECFEEKVGPLSIGYIFDSNQ